MPKWLFSTVKPTVPLVSCQVQSFLLPSLNRRNSAQHAKPHKSCFAIAVVTSFSLSWVFVAFFLWLVTVMWSSGYLKVGGTWPMFGYGLNSYCFCILGVQTNFIKKIKSIVQAIPCLTRSMFFKLFLKTLKFEFVLKESGAEFHNFSAK